MRTTAARSASTSPCSTAGSSGETRALPPARTTGPRSWHLREWVGPAGIEPDELVLLGGCTVEIGIGGRAATSGGPRLDADLTAAAAAFDLCNAAGLRAPIARHCDHSIGCDGGAVLGAG